MENPLSDIFGFNMESYFQKFVDNLDNEQFNNEQTLTDDFIDSSSVVYDDLSSNKEDCNLTITERSIAAKLAVYDSPMAAPRVLNLNADDYREFINTLATKTYQSSKEVGGNIPYTIIRENIENLIHAYFKEVVISIFDNGNTVRISDQGPGIKNKEKATEPGFSTATSEMKQYIKGVGSGLPITKETLSFLGGAILIEDNLNQGSVITLKVPCNESTSKSDNAVQDRNTVPISFVLNKRQKQILFLIMELGTVGPSKIAGELGISLSTAYRDLIYLEEQTLIYSDEQGKRVLTSVGIEYLDEILNS